MSSGICSAYILKNMRLFGLPFVYIGRRVRPSGYSVIKIVSFRLVT